MILTLKNTGIIKDAQIAFEGLTIIAGKNDTGKSTVGKLMFAIVKAFSRFEQDLHESQKKRIFEIIKSIYFQVRKQYSFEENIILKEEFNPLPFFKKVEKLLDVGEFERIDAILEAKISLLKNSDQNIIADIYKLKELIIKKEDKKSIITRALTKAFISEFNFEITHPHLKSFIRFSEGANNIFEIELEGDKITALEFYDEVFFNDVTFIETPILLQMYDVISSASTLLEIIDEDNKEQRLIYSSKAKIALHIKDLVSKLENAQYFSQQASFNRFNTHFRDYINRLIQGNFHFNKKQKDFIFQKAVNQEQSIPLKSINTASGIKSFGILQLLIESEFLDERSLLIIDEPETHLHPQWQVEYARLIIKLVENNIPVLLSSHSPYLIQALKIFSEKSAIQDKTKYYLAEETIDNLAKIVDVTDDLNRVFKILSEPLQELVWN